MIVLAASLAGSDPTVRAAEEILMPYPSGYAVKIIQGYHGGTHQGVERYSLDLVVANGATSGAPVTAPVSGRIQWAYAPWVGNGCLSMQIADGSGLGIMLCHVVFDRTFRSGETVRQGQRFGYVGPAGSVGNNGTPHVHMQLYAGGRGRAPLPFAYPNGRPLNGVSLPDTGRYNAHGGVGPIISGNTGGGGTTPAATPTPAPTGQSDERTVTTGASSRGGSARPNAAAPTMVNTPGECLNVRAEPSRNGALMRCLPHGTRITVIGGPVRADGYSWYHLQGYGWAAGEYLR